MQFSYLQLKHINESYTPFICVSELMSVQNGTSSGCTAVDEQHAYGLSTPHILHRVCANGLAAQSEKKQPTCPGNSSDSQSALSAILVNQGEFHGSRVSEMTQ